MSDEVRFVANLCNRQSALMLSGDGQRCLVELEAFGVNAAEALRMAIFAGKEIEIVCTELNVEAKQGPEREVIRVGRRRVTE